MELKKMFDVILRRKWIAIQAFLVIFLTTVIGSHFLIPIYETSARLLFEPPTMTSSVLAAMGMKEIAGFIPTNPQAVDIGTKVTLTKVNPLLEKVIFRLQVRNDQGELLSPEKLLSSSLLSRLSPTPFLSIQRDLNSNTVTITACSPDPHEAMFMANTIAEVYIEDSKNERKKETKNARSFIERQIIKVKEDYNNALKEITAFQERHKIVNLEIETKVAIEKLAELMKEKEDNIIDISETRARIETLKKQLKEQTFLSVPTSFIRDNPQIRRLKQDLSQLKTKLADELTDKKEDHPDVIGLNKQIKELEKELEKEVKIHQVTSPELNEFEMQLAALRMHLGGVNQDINKYARLIKTLPEKTSEETRLKLALTASQDIYSSLLDYHNRVGVAEAMALSDARLVQPALKPHKPVSPNKVLNGIMGAFLAFVFGFGLAFLAEYADDTLKSPQELEEYRELHFLGSIPRIGKPKLIAKLDANDPASEAYRTIRYSLKYASLDKPTKTFLITSSGPQEGKTLTVANLGISFSQTGSKVLMVDTDMRRATLHKLFYKPNGIGLTNVISEESQLEEAIVDTGIENLSLLPSGPTPPDPGRILESQKLRELIGTLSNRYDVVILDSAPVLVKSDATVLGHCVDGVIYILEAGKTTRGVVTETGKVFKKANISLLGTVLNRYEEKRAYYYHYAKPHRRRMIRIGGWRKKIFSVIFLTILIAGLGCSNPDMEEYLRELRSPNVVIKRETIYRIGELKIEEAVPELISLLNDGSGEISVAVIQALGKIGDGAAVEPLIAKLNENNPLVLEKTIEALGKIGDKKAILALASVLEQKDSMSDREVLTAIWALGNIGDRSAEPILNSLLKRDNNKYVRYNIEQALRKISTTVAESVKTVPAPQKGKMPQAKGTMQPSSNKEKVHLKKVSPAQPKSVPVPLPPKKEAPQVKKTYQSSKPPVVQKTQKFVKKKVSQPPEKKTKARKPKSEPRPQLQVRKKEQNAKGEDKSSPKMKTLKSPAEPGEDKTPQPKKAALPPASKAKANAAIAKPTERKQAPPEPHLFTFDSFGTERPRDRSTLIAQAWLADEMGPYTVHVDFKKYDESAKEIARKLKKMGYQVYIRKMDVAGRGMLYRVFIGGFQDKPAAEKAAKKLREEHYLFFVRVLPTSYILW